ncbi:hypothetical protein GIW81_04140 [Hyphomicrobium sp. xq]|uniref:DUF1508 domain-containing protein n=1 Tax=Hyphomicrobium album TaxID=2665159 RepID=A0A6I3KGI4_9HYPH|nr:hypothetical protein [Hyphomicrobium album]MTD93523.1 hypothetical protein [Hyphomicrobium album]
MTAVNITVVDAGTPEGWRWSVTRDGHEVESGMAPDEDAAYTAAKPHFDRLRLEMIHGGPSAAASEPRVTIGS